MHIPPHGCSLHFELYKTADDEYYIQMFYRKPDEEYPKPVPLKCGERWTLEQFYAVYKKIIPGDFETECAL